MQSPTEVDAGLHSRLESIEGVRILRDEPLSKYNTFRIGGPVALLAKVGTLAGLTRLIAELGRDGAVVPRQVLGLGSNVLIPDAGLPGLVIKLEGEFERVEFRGERVWAGAAVSLAQLARRTAAQGRIGLEALSGFPSTVGGAVVMNAGCYGTEIKDLLIETTVVDDTGRVSQLTVDSLEPGYRCTNLQGQSKIVADALFRTERGDPVTALARIQELNRKRKTTLPSGFPNVGSIFKNPPGDYAGRLIDLCGLKGRAVGGARISDKHGNVIVNFDRASAADVLELMSQTRAEVAKRFDVTLEPEVVLTGNLRECWDG